MIAHFRVIAQLKQALTLYVTNAISFCATSLNAITYIAHIDAQNSLTNSTLI